MVNFGGCKKSAPPGPRKALIAKYKKYNRLVAQRAGRPPYHPPCARASRMTSWATAGAAFTSADTS
jgi:hypothetical protein